MSKWWHSLATVGLVVFTAVTPVLQGVIASHPVVTTVLGAAWAIIGHLLPSPLPQR
jgi:hypothetical protein